MFPVAEANSEQRPRRKGRAEALNYEICRDGQFWENVAQGFSPAHRAFNIASPIAKKAGGRPGCQGDFRTPGV